MKIKKTSETAPTQASVVNQTNNSTEDSYSCNYANQHFGGILLWTNPNPTSSMAANTEINLSSSDYNILEIYYKAEENKVQSTRIIKGYDTRLSSCYYSSNIFGLYRNLTRVSDTKYQAGNCYYGGNGVTTDNSLCIPLYIVGYKTNLFN